MTLLIHATNIHSGGGAELLTAILKEFRNQGSEGILLVDSRFPVASDSPGNLRIVPVAPTLAGRLQAEWQFAALVSGTGANQSLSAKPLSGGTGFHQELSMEDQAENCCRALLAATPDWQSRPDNCPDP